MIEKITLTDIPWKFRLSAEKPDVTEPFDDTALLPSTVSQLQKSPVTDERSDGYLTDPYRFEGYALYERTVHISAEADTELFFVMERTRTSTLWINGRLVGSRNSLCAAHRYNITEFVAEQPVKITVMIDNVSCPVSGGHMTSPDTQTNWLGITGEIYIARVNRVRFENIRITPDVSNRTAAVTGVVCGGEKIALEVSVDGFAKMGVTVDSANPSFVYEMPGAALWSEHHPAVYTMRIVSGSDVTELPFGMREFSVRGTDFLLNGEKIFLRGKHDGMIFPMTGAAPTDTEGWLKVLRAAKEYGINHYRFHTCCPPDAAFRAADLLGIYMEPELPFWGTVEEELTGAQRYLVDEGFRILDSFANHPSFFAMSLGNELWGSKERLNAILGDYKRYDPRPLYTQGSNNFQFWPCVLENDDFFVGVRFSKERLFRGSYAMCDAPLGHIQTDAPNSDYTYDSHIRPSFVNTESAGGGTIEIQYGTGVKTVSMEDAGGEFVSEVPVVSHEVGQYFMYPDYREIQRYSGVLKPYNLEIFRERLEKAGLGALAHSFFRASGKFAAECYKQEIETALRSKELSGFQLLDIQDFTGQGTALVGVLNSFMESKGIISPEEWRQFCSDRVILGCLPKFVFAAGEAADMPVKLYNYSGQAVCGTVEAELVCCGTRDIYVLEEAYGASGAVTDLGSITIKMPEISSPAKAVLDICMDGIRNRYVLWIYPRISTAEPENAVVTSDWGEAKRALADGAEVLFLPKNIRSGCSVEGTYCTDFWNYPMFRSISESMNKPVPVGTLGLLIDNAHPALAEFPSECYSTAQWYDIVSSSRTVILDGTGIVPIVRTIDNCERNHSLGTIFEVSAGGGRLLVCTAPLDEKAESLPCMQLLQSLFGYLSSERFAPSQRVEIGVLDKFFEV